MSTQFPGPGSPAGAGIYTAVGVNVSWLNSNVAGVRKRSTAIGIQQLIGLSVTCSLDQICYAVPASIKRSDAISFE
ncbi:LOW QUALITY PROTEIN: hypothetical protein RTBOTA2_005741 [Rhodotorula toruloides]|nr:LOW QUALITY PROTEIN: hypothetical protein RTBOTA2_005741 [Rhodotorula toruloides]